MQNTSIEEFTKKFCGATHVQLNVNHIKPFALIVHRNKLKSTHEAQSCEALWDIKNGRTLCEQCHRATTTYGLPLINQQQISK